VDIDKKQVRDTLVVRLVGELDMMVTDRLRQELDETIDQGRVRVLIIDLERVSFIDSSGLGVLIGRYKKMTALNGRMFIVGAKASVEKNPLFFRG
jgi:Anti-anti-sigma regulatory factor (antagonist of anti-sigma factor)